MNLSKPLFWDIKKESLLSILLKPFTIIIRINNFLLNRTNKIKSNKITSICVGNIYLGGTGKTPLTIKLYKILKKINKKTVVAKKYYTSHKDEIILLKKETKLLTGNTRTEILSKAIKEKNEIVIFDDGLQDKHVDYNLKFVCFDSLNWIGNGNLLPAGPLRENLESLKKYDAVFFKIIESQNFKAIRLIRKINPKIKIFNLKYEIKNLNKLSLSGKYLIFSGIGNPYSFKKILKNKKIKIVDQIIFSDHYDYTNKEILKIIIKAKNLKSKIITTEKDFVKIPKKYQNKFNYLKIGVKINKEQDLINFLRSKINA